jgi:hypothetical protein
MRAIYVYVSVFPGNAGDAVVRVRITRQLADTLHTYFSIRYYQAVRRLTPAAPSHTVP